MRYTILFFSLFFSFLVYAQNIFHQQGVVLQYNEDKAKTPLGGLK